MLLRGLFIAGGITLLNRFPASPTSSPQSCLSLPPALLSPRITHTAAPPLASQLTRLRPVSPRQDRFLVRENGRPTATILLLALIAIELSDIVFALDSIPAVLSITRTPSSPTPPTSWPSWDCVRSTSF